MTPTKIDIEKNDARHLSPEAQQELRHRVVNSVINLKITQTAAAKMFGVSRVSVSNWVNMSRRLGDSILNSHKRGRKPNQGAALKPWQAATIVNIIRDRCPDQMKLPFFLWTREAVQKLISIKFNIDLALTTVGNYLQKWGFTIQKPAIRAYQQNSERVSTWLDEEYPKLLARAKREGGQIWWGDETGLRSRHVTGKTYGVRGQTPVVKATGLVFKINMVAAITNRGELAFMMYKSNFNAKLFLEFLQRLTRQAGRKVFLVLDNLRVHHAKAIQSWLKSNSDKIELVFLPSYSPHLNPAEILNQDLKTNSVGKNRAKNQHELIINSIRHMHERRDTPAVISAYFLENQVKYAADPEFEWAHAIVKSPIIWRRLLGP